MLEKLLLFLLRPSVFVSVIEGLLASAIEHTLKPGRRPTPPLKGLTLSLLFDVDRPGNRGSQRARVRIWTCVSSVQQDPKEVML